LSTFIDNFNEED
jgi:hypothetical protein